MEEGEEGRAMIWILMRGDVRGLGKEGDEMVVMDRFIYVYVHPTPFFLVR